MRIAGTAKTCSWLDKGVFLDIEIADCTKLVGNQTVKTVYKKYYYLISGVFLYYKNNVLVFADGKVPSCAKTELVDDEEPQDVFKPVTAYCQTNSYLFCQ